MLPTEFLTVTRWRDNIRPRYSKLDGRDVSTAEAVINVYAASVGRKRGEIRERVAELEDAYGSFKFVRGLAALVERSCAFTSRAAVNPLEARHVLFAEASNRGYPTSLEERRRMFEDVAARLKVSAEQLEASMYADLESEIVLESAPKLSPVELLKIYNLGLTQTLLFNATEMTFTAGGNWQRIFRAVKYYGLMYTVMRRNGQFAVRLDGPLSLFKLTRRYGVSLAKVLPEIFRGKPWRVEAKILRANRLFNFVLESGRHGWFFPETLAEEKYDSTVEEEFAAQFRSLDTVWTVRREAEPVEAGASIMIPDFSFQLGGTRVLMEVVGFWTRDYLRRKLEKLGMVRDAPFIVAVNEELACDKLVSLKVSNPNIHIIQYKRNIPVKQVLELLQPYAEAEVKAQTAELMLKVEKPVVTLRELAEKHGVTMEAIRRAAEKLETHTLIGETLIEKTILHQVKETLENAVAAETPLPKILEILKPYNLPDPVATITCCGFHIRWRGLLLENALVHKPKTTQ
ncbi:MAG: DUF790 family protein [Candidatus Bathyarchaeales archaeon]